jgi:ribosome-associated protein
MQGDMQGERIPISQTLAIDAGELEFSYIRSPGPGGQNVNKVASGVQLRFALMASPSLPQAVKARAARLAGSRLTQAGEIVIAASRFRSQPLNRDDAVARLVSLLQRAAIAPKRRIATRPGPAARRRRLEAKAQRGAIKRLRAEKPARE